MCSMRVRAVGAQVTPTEFWVLLLPACYREDTPTECGQSHQWKWVVFPEF